MPVKQNWKKIQCFTTRLEYEIFLSNNTSTSISTSIKVNCQVCSPYNDKHQMRYSTSNCSSLKCNFKYKLQI